MDSRSPEPVLEEKGWSQDQKLIMKRKKEKEKRLLQPTKKRRTVEGKPSKNIKLCHSTKVIIQVSALSLIYLPIDF